MLNSSEIFNLEREARAICRLAQTENTDQEEEQIAPSGGIVGVGVVHLCHDVVNGHIIVCSARTRWSNRTVHMCTKTRATTYEERRARGFVGAPK